MTPVVDVFLDEGAKARHNLAAHAGHRVGRARFNLRRGRITTTFSYDDEYLRQPYAFALDPGLPLRSGPQHCEGLFGCMRDSSPDRWGRHLIARRRRSVATGEGMRALDEVDYLLGVHDETRQGALRYAAPDSSEFFSEQGDIPPRIALPQLIAASNEVARGEEGIEELKVLLDAGSGSLGGARPKASIVDEGRILMAKFSHPGDEWAVMSWEKTALDIARAAGLPTPKSQLVNVGKNAALVLERFDRAESGVAAQRMPYMSAMTALGYADGAQADYIELAEVLPDLCRNPQTELRSLFARIALSIALHNTDDHLRNIGFIRTDNTWVLSPCFDINPNPHGADERVTAIYGETGSDEAAALAQVAAEFCGSFEQGRDVVRTVLDACVAWKSLAKKNGCPDRETELFASVFEAKCGILAQAFDL